MLVSSLLTYQTLSPAPEQRHRLRGAGPDLRRHRVVPQEAAGRPAAEDGEAGGGRGEGVRVRRVHAGADARGNTLGEAERAAMADKLARYTGLSPRFILSGEPARGLRRASARNCCATSAWSSGASTAGSPRSTPMPPASGRSSTRRTPRCRARTSPLFQDYVKNDAEVGVGPALPDVRQRPAVGLRAEPLHGQDRRAAPDDGEEPVPEGVRGVRLLRHGDARRRHRSSTSPTSPTTSRSPTACRSGTTRRAT